MFRQKALLATLCAAVAAQCAVPHMVHAESTPVIQLKGGVERFDSAGFSEQISKLTDKALNRNDDYNLAQELVRKFSTKKHKTKVVAKEFINAVVPYRGFSPSKEGSQIILEKIKKIKNIGCAEYIKQRIADETHTKTVGSVLQIALGLDCSDAEQSAELVNKGMDQLTELVGKETAADMLDVMKSWTKDVVVDNRIYEKKRWDIAELQNHVRNTTAKSFQADQVTNQIVRKLSKHDRSKIMMAVGTLVEAGTAMATLLSPGAFAPIASELFNATFVTSTGGSEPTKLVGEMYMSKRMESRWRRLNEESTLALTSYQRALESKSPTLLVCAESIMQHLVGQENTEKVVGELVVPSGQNLASQKHAPTNYQFGWGPSSCRR